MTADGLKKAYSIVVGGWDASEDTVFGESPHIPAVGALERHLASLLGQSVFVREVGRDAAVTMGFGSPDDEDLGVPVRFSLTMDTGATPNRTFDAVLEAVGKTPLRMSPGPLTLIVALFDDEGSEVARRTVTLR